MIGSYRAAIEKHRMISLDVLPRFTEYHSQRGPDTPRLKPEKTITGLVARIAFFP
jgi:hypothetical protein